jgi:hypothetical protein
MTQHERPTRLSSEPQDLLPGGNFRWIVALTLLGFVAVGAAFTVAIG